MLIAKSQYRPAVDRYVPQKGLILDAGCGLGGWLIHLHSPSLTVCGADLDLRALKRLKREFPRAPVCAADVVHLPYANSSFGGCLSFGVVEHLERHLEDAIKEAYRVLVPGGVFLVSVPFMNPLKKWILPKQSERPRSSAFFYQFVFTEEEISRVLRRNGFGVVDVHLVGRNIGIRWRSSCLRRMAKKPGYSGLSRRRAFLRALYDAVLAVVPKRMCAHMILLVCRKGSSAT